MLSLEKRIKKHKLSLDATIEESEGEFPCHFVPFITSSEIPQDSFEVLKKLLIEQSNLNFAEMSLFVSFGDCELDEIDVYVTESSDDLEEIYFEIVWRSHSSTQKWEATKSHHFDVEKVLSFVKDISRNGLQLQLAITDWRGKVYLVCEDL